MFEGLHQGCVGLCLTADHQVAEIAREPCLGRGAARGAGEALAQEGERGLDRGSAELLGGSLGDHAPPASPSVRVVLVDLDTDARILAQHRGFAALGRDRDDRVLRIGVDERHHVGGSLGVAAETCDPLAEQELVDLAAGELARASAAAFRASHPPERRPY